MFIDGIDSTPVASTSTRGGVSLLNRICDPSGESVMYSAETSFSGVSVGLFLMFCGCGSYGVGSGSYLGCGWGWVTVCVCGSSCTVCRAC